MRLSEWSCAFINKISRFFLCTFFTIFVTLCLYHGILPCTSFFSKPRDSLIQSMRKASMVNERKQDCSNDCKCYVGQLKAFFGPFWLEPLPPRGGMVTKKAHDFCGYDDIKTVSQKNNNQAECLSSEQRAKEKKYQISDHKLVRNFSRGFGTGLRPSCCRVEKAGRGFTNKAQFSD